MTNQYEASEQKGEPGHGFMAQVFDPNGDAAANFDMTADWSVATGRAALCAEALNMKDATGLTPAQLAAKCASLEKDAERWRKIKKLKSSIALSEINVVDRHYDAIHDIDAAIDSMEATPQ